MNNKSQNKQQRTFGIILSAILMVLFGLAEIVTGFTHSFMGITTSGREIFTYASAAIGVCYILAGLLVLTMKKWAAILAIAFLGVDITGRIALTLTGLYPTDTFENTFAIIAGTAIAAIFAVYIGWRLLRRA